jgi:hypothetical protein
MVAWLRGVSTIIAKGYWHTGKEYILEIDPDPRTNLERVAQALG